MLVNVVATWTMLSGERLQSIGRINDATDLGVLGDAVNVGRGSPMKDEAEIRAAAS
jgi:hypothetical protein